MSDEQPPHRSGVAARLLASVVVRGRWLVVPAVVAAAVWCGFHAQQFQTDGPVLDLVPKDAPALKAEANSARLFGFPAGTDTAVVVRDPDRLGAAQVQAIAGQARTTDSHQDAAGVRFALPILNVNGVVPGSRETGTTAITYLAFDPGVLQVDRERLAKDYAQVLPHPPGGTNGITGVTPAQLEQGRLILDRLGLIEVLTLVAIGLIILLTFRSPGAALATLATVGVTFAIALWGLGEAASRLGLTLPQEIEPLVVALLLGVVTDYTVFFLSDFRDRLHAGGTPADCAQGAAAAVAPIVFTGGIILSVSLVALRTASVDFFRNLGPVLAITVLIAMLVCLVFVPALLALLGRAAVWPSHAPADGAGEGRRLRERFAYGAAGRPGALAISIVCLAALAVGAYQMSRMRVGIDAISGLPSSSEARKAADAAGRGFAPGILGPVEVDVQSGNDSPLDPLSLARLQRALGSQPGYAGVVGPADQPIPGVPRVFVTPDGRAARYLLVGEHDPLGASGIDDLRRLDAAMPALLDDAGMGGDRVDLAGQTPLARAAVDAVRGDAVRVIAAVLLVNLLMLIAFMRALVTPVVLLAVTVLSVGAALGLTTWLFQTVLGYPDITYYVPFAAAVLLVSLSSDYNVLVTGRIWQEAGRRPLRDAIAVSAPRTSRAIRAAGMSLAASFALLAVIPIRSFLELAVAMVSGIVIETYVVRSLLAPGVIAVLGGLSGWPGRPGWSRQVPAERGR